MWVLLDKYKVKHFNPIINIIIINTGIKWHHVPPDVPKWKRVLVTQSCPTLCDPMACILPGSCVHGLFQARILEWVAIFFSRVSSQPRDRTQVSCIAGGFLPAELQGKPKNTGVGSLYLLQQIFPIQELNQSLLHCRRILYQLSYKGSPETVWLTKMSGSIPFQSAK